MDETDHGLTPLNGDSKVNRKANGIMGLRNHPYTSASFPTASFGSENKSTPK
jgi:hypothetical protein